MQVAPQSFLFVALRCFWCKKKPAHLRGLSCVWLESVLITAHRLTAHAGCEKEEAEETSSLDHVIPLLIWMNNFNA
ncbi:hypothetical protein CD201_16460 [Hafnia alvei]|jgi:hypothetical protein|nr:hypothetical protein CD201_16460 [Hafnia alvei]KID04215.1 hypothetical protein PU00_07415 [Hafnia alvei]